MSKKALLVALAALVVVAPSVLAADYLPKDRQNDGNVTVSGTEDYHNLYVAGRSVNINKDIGGDLFAAGASVNINGAVEKDLFAAGANINLVSPVGEDARIAGGNLTVSAPVGGDLLIAGGTISLSKGANVGGDFWAAGGAINLNNNVKGSGKIVGGEILINGTIEGDLMVRADEKLVFGPDAKVAGQVVYYGEKEAVIQEGAEVGSIDFRRVEEKRGAPAKAFTVFFLVKLLTLLVAAIIALRLLKKTSLSVVTHIHKRPWFSLGIGFLGLIVIPVSALILLFTIIGLYAGLVLAIWFVFALLMGAVFMVLFIGSLVERWISRKKEIALTWRTAVWGVLAGGLISLVPFAGWLAMFILYLISFGGVLQTVKERLEASG